jgi:NodT family efflux transporter outer membrane factor (OMF) lipoprotein
MIRRWGPFTSLTLAVCSCILGGCNLAPRYNVPTTPAPVAYKEAGSWEPASPADAIPRGAWWTIYDDQTLNDLERQIDTQNPTLAGSVAAYDRAQSFAAEAEAGLLPTVELDGQLSTNKQSANRPLRGGGEPTYYGANLIGGQAGYELDFWGRVRNAVAAGQAAAAASAADVESVRLMLHAELAQDYAALRGMDQQEKLIKDTVGAYTRARELTQNLFQGKLESLMDVTRATTQLQRAHAQVSDIVARRALYEHAIATLIGKAPAELAVPASVAPIEVPTVPTGLPATLLQRRPDIAAAERRAAAANRAIGIARAAFFPIISLTGSAGYQATNLNLLQMPNEEWSIGPGMSLPLFEGGLLRARLQESKAAFDEAANNYRGTVLQAFREIEDELVRLHWLQNEWQQERAAAEAAQQTLDMALALYQNGATSYLDVVTAQTSALTAKREVLALETRRIQASIALIRALGGGWSVQALQPGSRS